MEARNRTTHAKARCSRRQSRTTRRRERHMRKESGMRKVVAVEYVTLDGVITDPGGVGEIEQGGWSNRYFDEELADVQTEQLFASDALLLGRVTFEGFA